MLRPYQIDALNAIKERLGDNRSTLLVMATGCGKTQVFAHLIADRLHLGRAMVIAHREELIDQAARRVAEIARNRVEVEMADQWTGDGTMYGGAPIVVATVQTLASAKRMARFEPGEFATLVVDEAHHGTADSYRNVLDYFKRNERLKIVGVTATPDRTDEEALGQIFQSVAFDYEIIDAVMDGWLVKPLCRTVKLAGLDLSSVRTVAGELNQEQLADELARNENLEAIAAATVEHSANRQTLVFSDSITRTYLDTNAMVMVKGEGSAPKITNMLNGHKPGSARLIHGGTPKDERKTIVDDYRGGRFQYLVNVGVATEGFDVPDVSCVVLARPTKSRSLMSQMVGRGTRTASAIAVSLGTLPTDVARRRLIAASSKPSLLVLDFVDNTNRLDLIHPADILGGRVSERAVKQVNEATQGMPVDVIDELFKVDAEIRHNDQLAAATNRQGIKAKQKTSDRDPFAIYGLERRERRWSEPEKPAEQWQLAKLERWGIKNAEKLDFSGAQQVIEEYQRRARNGLCTVKQAAMLRKHGYDGEMPYEQARAIMDELSKNWKR